MKHVFSSCSSGNIDHLLFGGFVHIGAWHAGPSGSITFQGSSPVPGEPGVYVYAIGDEVLYVGSAQRGLNRRLRHYENSKKLRTTIRIREAVLKELSQGTIVDIYVIVLEEPLTLHGGLPIDPVAGVEEGLIRDIKPKWNRRGSGAR